MTKLDLINNIVSNLVYVLDNEQLQIVKAACICRMQGYDIHEVNMLPSTEVINNDFIFQRFIIDQTAKGLSMKTLKSYMYIIKPFFNWVNKDFREVTAQDITDYLAIRKITPGKDGKMMSQNYISNICRVLFVFFQWLYRKHHLEQDIMRDVDRIRPKQKRKERLTPEETEACRDCCLDNRDRALFEYMISTGSRVGEIAKLRIEDIDFQARRVKIHGEKSESSERIGFLSIRARNALKKYIGDRQSGYVFRPCKKSVVDSVPVTNGSLEKWAKAIGERARVHCITTVHVYRKTFATEQYRRTKDVKYVSILLGHSSSAVTEKYYLVDDMQDIEYMALKAA